MCAAGLSIAAAACGGGDSTGTNTPPTADFTASCNDLDCTFTDASTPGDGTITTYAWDFGVAGATSDQKNPTYSYSTGGDYTVKLTVTDDKGESGTKTKTVTAGSGAGNNDPIAEFTYVCDKLVCTFTDASEDTDGTIASWSWDFGDGTAKGTDQNPVHTYTADGQYPVTLTVTDNDGATNSIEATLTVSATNNAPSAEFSVKCNSLDCEFTDKSTDSDGTIASWDWDLGDGATSTVQNPTHSYAVTDKTDVTVKLTVTDNQGGTSSFSKSFTVAPPATLTCGGADCTLKLDQASTVTVTLESASCKAKGNKFVLTAPVVDTLFKDGCNSPLPGTPEATFQLHNTGGTDVFDANTELQAEVISGSLHEEFAPALEVTGTFADGWTLKFDDGEGGLNEPDFNDLVIKIVATPQ